MVAPDFGIPSLGRAAKLPAYYLFRDFLKTDLLKQALKAWLAWMDGGPSIYKIGLGMLLFQAHCTSARGLVERK